jgi:hypothetical protein
MIRCVCAKSSLCYPEVVHRFCGYLVTRGNFLVRRRACVVKQESAELLRAGKKNRRLRIDAGHAEDAVGMWCGSGFSLTSDSLLATLLLLQPCTGEIRGENAVACAHQIESRAFGPVAQWLVQGTHRERCLRGESREVDGMNSGNPSGRTTDGNPEPSRRCTAGRCRDYLRAAATSRERP